MAQAAFQLRSRVSRRHSGDLQRTGRRLGLRSKETDQKRLLEFEGSAGRSSPGKPDVTRGEALQGSLMLRGEKLSREA